MPPPNNYVAQLRRALKGTPMQRYARVIAQVEARNRLPRGLLAGIAKAESSFGTAGRSGHQTNPFGWMRAGGPSAGLMSFPDMAAAIRHVGNTLGERGWRDPAKFEQTYVGYTNSPWLGNVQGFMRQFGAGPPTVTPQTPRNPDRPRTRNGSTQVSVNDPDINRKMMLMMALMTARSSSSSNSMAAMLPLLLALKSPRTPSKTITNVGPVAVEVGPGVTGREKEIKEILGIAKKFIGTQYIFGSAGGRSDFGKRPTAFDCSGFISYLWYKATGKKMPAYTGAQVVLGREIPRGKIEPGDALFFDTYQKYGHTGLYLGNGKFIHASSSGGVKISVLASYPYKPSAIRRYDV